MIISVGASGVEGRRLDWRARRKDLATGTAPDSRAGSFNGFLFSGGGPSPSLEIEIHRLRPRILGTCGAPSLRYPIAGHTVRSFVCSAQVGGEVAQARQDVGNCGAGSQESGVGQRSRTRAPAPQEGSRYEGYAMNQRDNATGCRCPARNPCWGYHAR